MNELSKVTEDKDVFFSSKLYTLFYCIACTLVTVTVILKT